MDNRITEEECIEFLSKIIENDSDIFSEINNIQKINEYIQRNINQWQIEFENKVPILIKEETLEKMHKSFDRLAVHNDNLKRILEEENINFQMIRKFGEIINKEINKLIPNYVNLLGELEKIAVII